MKGKLPPLLQKIDGWRSGRQDAGYAKKEGQRRPSSGVKQLVFTINNLCWAQHLKNINFRMLKKSG